MMHNRRHPFSLWAIVILSFLLQFAAIGMFHTYRFRTTDNNFAFGWEMGCIGRALASGSGFSDPFCIGAGPTAWEPPVYPYLIGAVFTIFGIYSKASAWILLGINSLFSALTSIPIYFAARRLFGEVVARRAAWTWALLPYAWYWAIHWIWDTTITPFVLTILVLASMKLEDAQGVRGWIGLGLLWGLAVLLNPSLIAFLPFCLAWIWFRRRRLGLRSARGLAVSGFLFIVAVAPWIVRNYRTFGLFIFIRDNLAQELWLGNGPGATGLSRTYLMPNRNRDELEKLRQMGELPYLEGQKDKAMRFIGEDPGRFLHLSAKRMLYYWSGIARSDDNLAVVFLRISLFSASSLLAIFGLVRALWRKLPGASLLALLMASYPLIYYFVYPHARYRHPIEPVMVILIVYLISDWAAGRRQHENTSRREREAAPISAKPLGNSSGEVTVQPFSVTLCRLRNAAGWQP